MTASGDSFQKDHKSPAPSTTSDQPWVKGRAQAFGVVILGLLLGFSGSTFTPTVFEVITGSPPSNNAVRVAVASVGLWLGLSLVPGYFLVTRGGTLKSGLGLSIRPRDLWLGLIIGVSCQFVLLPILYLPLRLLDRAAFDQVSDPANDLINGLEWPGKLLIFICAGLLAPLMEELFFRGFAFKVFGERASAAFTVIITAVIFGIYHFQEWQTVGLVAVGLIFAYLRLRTGRLGPSIVAHAAFNCAALAVLFFG